tara:strand:- start:1677 stop:4067 length:2391 start_codon:yes stop_codon:yes gene_type:complete
MAEEIVMEVKSNLSTVTKDAQQLESSLDLAGQSFDNLTEQIYIQKTAITQLELEYLQLQSLAISTPRTASAGYPQLLEKIRETKEALQGEKISLRQLNTERINAKDAINELSKGQGTSIKGTESLVASFTRLGGQLVGVKYQYLRIIPAAKKMFMAIKAGMISTGIGALVVALGLVVAALASSDEAASKSQVAWTSLGVGWDQYTKKMGNFADALLDVFSGEWASAWENIVSGADVSSFLSGAESAIEKTFQLEHAQKKLLENEREISIQLAEKKIIQDELNRTADDATATEEQRIQAATESFNMEVINDDLKRQNAEQAIANLKLQIELEGENAENLNTLATLEINLINIRRKAANDVAKFDKKVAGINASAENRAKKRHSAYRTRQNERAKIQNNFIKKQGDLIDKYNDQNIIDEDRRQKVQLARQLELDKAEVDRIYDFGRNRTKAEQEVFAKNAHYMNNLDVIHRRAVKKIDDATKKETENALKESLERRREINDAWSIQQLNSDEERQKEELRIEEEGEYRKLQETKEAQEEDISRWLKWRTKKIDSGEELDAQEMVWMADVNAKKQAIDDEYFENSTIVKAIYADKTSEIEQEQIDKDKEQAKELADFKLGLLTQGFEVVSKGLDIQAAQIEKNYKDEVKLAQANGGDLEKIEAKYDEKRKKNAEKQKAMSIGLAIIDTYQSAVAAYSSALAIPGAGIAMAPIAAGLAVAAGLANIAMIKGADVGSGGGGGGGSPGGLNAPAAPPSDQMMSGSFELEGGQAVDPLQAYVVSDDITANQDKLAVIRRRATI